MKFSVTGSELTSRSVLEGLAEEGTAVQTKDSCKVKVSAKLLIRQAGHLIITVTYYKNTANLVVNGPMAIRDQCFEVLIAVEAAYVALCGGWGGAPIPTCSMPAQMTWRIPPRSDFMVCQGLPQLLAEQETTGDEVATPAFRAAVNAIAVVAQRELAMFPKWQEKMLQILHTEFGVDVSYATEDSSYVQLDSPAQPRSSRAQRMPQGLGCRS